MENIYIKGLGILELKLIQGVCTNYIHMARTKASPTTAPHSTPRAKHTPPMEQRSPSPQAGTAATSGKAEGEVRGEVGKVDKARRKQALWALAVGKLKWSSGGARC